MLNKLYFSLYYSIELSSLRNELRGLNSLFTIVNKSPELHSCMVQMDYKIKRYVITQVSNHYYNSPLNLSHAVNLDGMNMICAEFLTGAIVPIFYWRLHFAGYVRPGKQPLSNTAVIISRVYPYRHEFQFLMDVLR